MLILEARRYGGPMENGSFQRIAYAALIVLMFGITTGWLSGL